VAAAKAGAAIAAAVAANRYMRIRISLLTGVVPCSAREWRRELGPRMNGKLHLLHRTHLVGRMTLLIANRSYVLVMFL
jgi:hypothetical protein